MLIILCQKSKFMWKWNKKKLKFILENIPNGFNSLEASRCLVTMFGVSFVYFLMSYHFLWLQM